MGRLTDDMARIQQDVKSQVSITSTQLAEFKLSRARDTARDSRERAMFVVENCLSVNRMLKEFHDLRIANGQQDRADRIAFVSDMVKKRAELLEKLSATRNVLRKDVAIGRLAASKQPEPAIDAGIVTSEMNAGLLNTRSAVAPKAAAPVPSKAAAPAPSKAAAPAPSKAAAPVPSKAAAPVPSKAAAPVPSKAAAPVPSKAAAPVPSKAAAPVPSKAAAPAPSKAAAPVPSKAAAPVPSKAAAPVPSKAAAPVPSKAAAPVPSKTAAPVKPKAGALAKVIAPKSVKPKRNR
jgi:hypothetical protein